MCVCVVVFSMCVFVVCIFSPPSKFVAPDCLPHGLSCDPDAVCRRRIPKGQEWGGNPAQFVRDLSKAELNHKEAEAEEAAEAYLTHGEEFLPVGFSYVQVR